MLLAESLPAQGGVHGTKYHTKMQDGTGNTQGTDRLSM